MLELVKTERTITAVETAKIIKKELKKLYPLIKFSVRTKIWTIYIDYEDGYKRKEIEDIADKYQGSDFDGMQDLQTYRKDCVYRTDYIFVQRKILHNTFEQINKLYGEIFGVNRLEIDCNHNHWTRVNNIIYNLDFTKILKDENNNYNEIELKQAILNFLHQ
jgi:hypothetical protein